VREQCCDAGRSLIGVVRASEHGADFILRSGAYVDATTEREQKLSRYIYVVAISRK